MASIEKRGNSFRIKVSCGYKADGSQVVQRMTWMPEPDMTAKQIEKEVQRQAVLFEEACKCGQIVSAVKFEPFAEEWFESTAKLNLRSTTYSNTRKLTKRTYAAIGHIRIDKLTPRVIQNFINDLAKEGANKHTGGVLSRKSMVHYLSFISTVLEHAVKMDMLSENPCRRVAIPKGSKKERKIYTMEQTETFLKLLDDAPLKWRTFFTLDIYSGMRKGELLGLEWGDIDFETGFIHIQRTSNYTKERGLYTDTTKTESSVRYVRIPAEVIELLKKHKDDQREYHASLGDKWTANDRLFTGADGNPMGAQAPYNWLYRFCKKHDFPFYGIHSFRHLYCSLLIGAGIDPTTVSGILGHSCATTTLSLYSHMFKENQVKAFDAVADAFSLTKKNPETA